MPTFDPKHVPKSIAQEMAEVGIIPGDDTTYIGEIVKLDGHPFMVTGEVSRKEWMARITEVYGKARAAEFEECPAHFRFWKVSTD